MNVTFLGREVRNPVLRMLVAVLVPLIAIPVLIVLIPLSLPWHLLLRLVGHRGFTAPGSTPDSVAYNVPLWGVALSLAPVVALVVL